MVSMPYSPKASHEYWPDGKIKNTGFTIYKCGLRSDGTPDVFNVDLNLKVVLREVVKQKMARQLSADGKVSSTFDPSSVPHYKGMHLSIGAIGGDLLTSGKTTGSRDSHLIAERIDTGKDFTFYIWNGWDQFAECQYPDIIKAETANGPLSIKLRRAPSVPGIFPPANN